MKYVGKGKCKSSWSSREEGKQKKKQEQGECREKGGNLGRIVVVVNIVDGVGGWMIGIGTGMEWNVGSLGLDEVTVVGRKGGSRGNEPQETGN